MFPLRGGAQPTLDRLEEGAMKLEISGASNFVNRMFEACGAYQWARELLKNALEASATRVEFGIEWQAVKKLGVYRRTVMDNGCGMSRDELLKFFSTLGVGAKKIGGIHENFGVGARIASLPWNQEGVVVISYRNGQASMIWIVLDPDSGDYNLVEFKTGTETACVIDPTEFDWERRGVDWGAIRAEWIKEHGTVVVLLGSKEYPDTVQGNPHGEEEAIKGLSVYLNSRFWDLSKVDVRVVELRSEKKSQWPEDKGDRDDARRPNNRKIMGARHYLTDVEATGGRLLDSNVMALDGERIEAEWYLWDGERPHIHSYAKRPGYIAVRYKDELFELTSNKAYFRWFGVVESKVQQNLTIILEPQHYQANNGRWGIHPDQSRNRLIFTGNGEKGVALPLSDWGLEFADNLPGAILKAIHEARGEFSGSIEDEEYRKRLQDRFGDRWKMKVLVKARENDLRQVSGTLTDEEVGVSDDQSSENRGTRERKRTKTVMIVQKKMNRDGSGEGVEREAPVDVPKYRFAMKDEFEKPWHIALWAPNAPDGPTVLINAEAPVLQEVIEYHRAQYPDIYAEEVTKTVQQVFGEVATCKVAHSQKLSRTVPKEELDREYRSEQALTLALMGLLAEETVIAQRLGRLGRKKPTT
jgi:Histidine kinase-, DNA gyrase B-, and HSP90-like ATPase